jgi:hypothetical protein
MKKLIAFALLFLIIITSFSQQPNSTQPLTHDDYLKKSKNQKSAAWALLGGGVALMGIGYLVGDQKESSFDDAATGAVMAGVGILAAIGSIPLFIASGKNKRKAMSISTSFDMQRNLFQKGTALSFRSHPALSLKLNF